MCGAPVLVAVTDSNNNNNNNTAGDEADGAGGGKNQSLVSTESDSSVPVHFPSSSSKQEGTRNIFELFSAMASGGGGEGVVRAASPNNNNVLLVGRTKAAFRHRPTGDGTACPSPDRPPPRPPLYVDDGNDDDDDDGESGGDGHGGGPTTTTTKQPNKHTKTAAGEWRGRGDKAARSKGREGTKRRTKSGWIGE
ncbi:hypothetical protein niasHT_037713 [Heterodera trifolii]|uniref:Uncharacterized protein n=1 Tax=Heterodera trifolii TaxID=157864 RepID=A0ABD2IU97_9BILA